MPTAVVTYTTCKEPIVDYIFLIILLVFMVGMLFFQSRKAKKQNQELQDFRKNLQPGTEIITIGGVIGKVVDVDEEYEEIVIDSEGSQMRFAFKAVSRQYVRPAYVHDDEVDEEGNPLPQEPKQIEDAEVTTEVQEDVVAEEPAAAAQAEASETEKDTKPVADERA